MGEIEGRLAALEGRVAALESQSGAHGDGGGGARDTSTLPADKLSEPWAAKEIKRLPPKWKHRDVVGMTYDKLTPVEAKDLAGYHQWKADKGRTEVPVRVNTAGKPWWESDAFNAKLLRTWAEHGASAGTARWGRTGAGAVAKHAEPGGYAGSAETTDAIDDDSAIPFATPFDVGDRRGRRMARWLRA